MNVVFVTNAGGGGGLGGGGGAAAGADELPPQPDNRIAGTHIHAVGMHNLLKALHISSRIIVRIGSPQPIIRQSVPGLRVDQPGRPDGLQMREIFGH